MFETDIVVVGGGIAGVSIAYELASSAKVVLVEQEEHLAYHTTGRSAAFYMESYGSPIIRALTSASRGFFEEPEDGFDRPLLAPRGALVVADQQSVNKIPPLAEELRVAGAPAEIWNGATVLDRVPILKPDCARLGLFEPLAMEIDVASLHQGYVRGFRARGGQIRCLSGATCLTRLPGRGWEIEAGGKVRAGLVINAAGAWADEVAERAGLCRIGLMPLRRTAIIVDLPVGTDSARWPLVIAADESFYFKPEGEGILASPADETPDVPCDVQPDEMDIAGAAYRIEQATTLSISRIKHKWAGLRTFAPDRRPVIGPDPADPAFFWFAGQGGYGIQMAPAAARLAATMIAGKAFEHSLEAIDATQLLPSRFAMAA